MPERWQGEFMSKRYGRNQKRQAKEKIARLEKQNQSLQERGARNADIVRDTARVLGNYFVTLPIERQQIECLEQLKQGWRIVHEDLECNYAVVDDYSDRSMMRKMTERTLNIIHGDSHIRGELRKMVHIEFYYGGERVGYGVDEQALCHMPKSVAVERVSAEMADLLVSSVIKKVRR